MSDLTMTDPLSASTDHLHAREPRKLKHASDPVFRVLAGAILNRTLPAGEVLPPERELSMRFGVSRIVVREAVHRLKEYQLVRVSQGRPTLVLDPDRSTDTRLLALELELSSSSPELRAAFQERQLYSAAAMLDLAEQRMETSELNILDELTRRLANLPAHNDEWRRLECAYWTVVAAGSRNRLYVRGARWYVHLLERQPKLRSVHAALPEDRVSFYLRLNQALRAREGAAAVYLAAIRCMRSGAAD